MVKEVGCGVKLVPGHWPWRFSFGFHGDVSHGGTMEFVSMVMRSDAVPFENRENVQ